jgi:hypothetical protein
MFLKNKRWLILNDLLRNKQNVVGAEVGVFRGYLTKFLLDMTPQIKKYYCIDPWASSEYGWSNKNSDQDWNEVFANFKENVSSHLDKIEIMKMLSIDAANIIENKNLDFAFLDGNHRYKFVKEDISLWCLKIKPGGFISGHDYGNPGHTEVKKAVDEMFDNVEVGEDKTWWAQL